MWERKHPGHDPDRPSTNWSEKHVWGYWPKHYALNGFKGGKEVGFTQVTTSMLMAMAERIIKYNFYRGDDELRESLDYGYSYDREQFLD